MSTPFRALFRIIWPNTCALCGRALTSDENAICLHCLSELPLYGNPDALYTTTPFIGAPGNTIRLLSWFGLSADSPSRNLIYKLKYRDRPRLAHKLGQEMGRQLMADGVLPQNASECILLPIPMHYRKRFFRGYNQAHLIALGISGITGISVGNNLKATKPHTSQTFLNREEREANLQTSFRLNKAHELNGKHIIIVDDIHTTGATLSSATKAILAEAKSSAITHVVLARRI